MKEEVLINTKADKAVLKFINVDTVSASKIIDFVASGNVNEAPCHVLITIRDENIIFTSLAPENMVIKGYPYLDAVDRVYYSFIDTIEVTKNIKEEVVKHLLNKYKLDKSKFVFKNINYSTDILLEPYLEKANHNYVTLDMGILLAFIDEYSSCLDYRIEEDDIRPLFDKYIETLPHAFKRDINEI